MFRDSHASRERRIFFICSNISGTFCYAYISLGTGEQNIDYLLYVYISRIFFFSKTKKKFIHFIKFMYTRARVNRTYVLHAQRCNVNWVYLYTWKRPFVEWNLKLSIARKQNDVCHSLMATNSRHYTYIYAQNAKGNTRAVKKRAIMKLSRL